MKNKNCVVCAKDYSSRRNVCSDECGAEIRKTQHKMRLTSKSCKECSNIFLGKRTEVRCSECKCLPISKELKVISCITLCKVCGRAVSEVKKFLTKTSATKHTTCKECRSSSQSKRMYENNPMRDPKIAKKVGTKVGEINKSRWAMMSIEEKRLATAHLDYKITDEHRAAARLRMLESNPMFDPIVKQRCIDTKSSRNYEYVRGEEHWLWKGNRDRAQTIRTRLFPVWTKPHLENAKYTCSRCKKIGGRLEVHHTVPFRDILETALRTRALSELDNNDFEKLVLDIIELHTNIRGEVLCVPCHRAIDSKRH